MAKQTINLGTPPTGAGGDTSRSGVAKLQANDDELYTFLGAADGTLTAEKAKAVMNIAGHAFYKTLAIAQAAQASLPANTIVKVTNDGANNGTYQWNGTTLTKSAYDPLTQAKAYADLNNPSFRVITLVDGVTTLTAEQAKSKILYFQGTLTADAVVEFPKQNGDWTVQNGTTGNFNIVLKVIDQSPAYIEISPNDVSRVYSQSSAIRLIGRQYAKIASPTFTGSPKAPTAAASANDTTLATTEFSQRSAKGIVEINVSAGGTINLTTLQMSYPLIRLVGALTADTTINFTAGIGKYTINNRTTGGFNTIIKGFNQSSAFVVIKPGYTEDIQLYTGVVSKLQSENTPYTLPIATSSTLGGVKIGTGLQVDADGTVNAVGGGGVELQRYVGKFNFGQNYAIGDVVEHGSGNYQVVIDVTGADTAPNLSASHQKISHNLYAGANRKLTKISSTSETVNQVDIPAFMDKTGKYCIAAGGRYVGYSTDYGKTYPTMLIDLGASTAARWIKQTGDGELLICSATVVSGQANTTKIWKSTGWKGDGIVPTWTTVFQFQRQNIYLADWGFSQHGAFVLITDYGEKATSEGQDYPRYVYLSKDYGKTFTQIFDLGSVTDSVGVHMHGSCFDPYWGRIWVSFGDGSFKKNGLLYSDDLGANWTWALQNNQNGINFSQSVHIVALPTCILFGSDSYPNGVQRLDRSQGKIPTKGYYTVDAAWMIPDQPNYLAFLFHQVTKAEWLPNSPYIFVYGCENHDGKSGAVATFDGWNFYEVWIDSTNNSAGYGGRSVIGVTPLNEVIIGTFDAVRDGGWKKITVKVSID